MNSNEQLIHRFYTAFQNRDFKTMQACYAEDATFEDPAFGQLNASEVKAMWEMLLKADSGLRIEYNSVNVSGNIGSARWIARYRFSASGRQVINRVHAEFSFEQGRIKTHRDHFNFYTWARQALGLTGWLLGLTPFLKRKVRTKALGNLQRFITTRG